MNLVCESIRVMVYLNSAVNPILYNLMSSKFRNGFLRLFGLKGFARQGTFTSSSTTTTGGATTSSSAAVAQANNALLSATSSLHRPLTYRLSSQQVHLTLPSSTTVVHNSPESSISCGNGSASVPTEIWTLYRRPFNLFSCKIRVII